MSSPIRIESTDTSPLFDTAGMELLELPSDFRKIRHYAFMLVQHAPQGIKELNLLEQQVSEIIKNAIKHGNSSDPSKKIRIWYCFTDSNARIIVEDEGQGFKELDEWNAFNKKRVELMGSNDSARLSQYVAWRGPRSDENDGGNAFFGALEYWNRGLVFNTKKNRIAASRDFQTKD